MSAVEEYRTARLWGSDMAEEQLCAADAAIAELEALVEANRGCYLELTAERNLWEDRAEQAEATLDEPLPDFPHMIVDPPARCEGCYVIVKALAHAK